MKKRILFLLSTLSLLLNVIPLSSCTVYEVVSNIKKNAKKYSDEELQAIYASSIKALNEVNYPSKEKKHLPYDNDFIKDVYSFNNKVFAKNLKSDNNFAYSPTNLYSSLHFLSLGASNEAVALLDECLGSKKETRSSNYKKYFENNYFVNDHGMCNIYNGLFMQNKDYYTINEQYLEQITPLYCEAYSLNLHDDASLTSLVDNINKKVNEKGLLNKDDLTITDDTAFILFNTLYFESQWSSTFSTSDNYEDKFYSKDSSKDVTYMTHSFVGPLNEYENHIVFEDYLMNGYKVRYYISKDSNQDIRDFVDEANYYDELIYDSENIKMINLSIPKFEFKNTVNFNNTLKEMGLSTLFESKDNFNDCFTFLDNNAHFTYIENSLQATKVKFDNDGAKFSSIQATTIGESTSAAPIGDTYQIKAENPFIFEIRDEFNLPILFGYLNNINN